MTQTAHKTPQPLEESREALILRVAHQHRMIANLHQQVLALQKEILASNTQPKQCS